MPDFRVHFSRYVAGGRMMPTHATVFDVRDAAAAVAYLREHDEHRTARLTDCRVEELSTTPGDAGRKEKPMEASGSTATNTTNGGSAPADDKKEKRELTKYHVLRLVEEQAGDGGAITYELVNKTAVAASSTTQAIELTLADGHGNGTYIAVPERSFQPKRVKVEEVKTTKVVVA